MNRVAAATILAVLVAAPARAGDAPPAKAPVAVADWEARDAEARWVAYRASIEKAGGASEEEWVAFLRDRKEWDLLEWIALTSRRPEAMDALAGANAPQWIRCALWRRKSTDTHALGGARAWLVDKRPGLVLAWLERFPSAAPELLADLKKKDPPREDASKHLAPLDPERVLRGLVPPADLEDLGDRPSARSDGRYVHQVERAISVLERAALFGEPWAARLAALLSHPHPRVRRAAALAYAHRPQDEIPLAALEGRIADEKEVPAVRAAALLGLSYSDHPSVYARLVHVASAPPHPAWRAAVSRLGDLDDGFFLAESDPLKPSPESPEDRIFLYAQVKRIEERRAARDAARFGEYVLPMLYRAAWADLGCDPLEGTLVPWTLRAIHARIGEPEVREEVGKVGTTERAPPMGPVTGGATPEALRDRVRQYAADILKGDEKAFGPR